MKGRRVTWNISEGRSFAYYAKAIVASVDKPLLFKSFEEAGLS